MKADSDLWISYSGVTNDDSFGFAVLPTGRCDYGGSFFNRGNDAYFWSSTEDSNDFANIWDFGFDYDGVYNYWDNKIYGFSVRCLKD